MKVLNSSSSCFPVYEDLEIGFEIQQFSGKWRQQGSAAGGEMEGVGGSKERGVVSNTDSQLTPLHITGQSASYFLKKV